MAGATRERAAAVVAVVRYYDGLGHEVECVVTAGGAAPEDETVTTLLAGAGLDEVLAPPAGEEVICDASA